MRSEFDKMYADTSVDEDESSNLEYRGSFTALEQINKYNYGFLRSFWIQIVFYFRKCGQDKKSKQGGKIFFIIQVAIYYIFNPT
jgi:hypothetical protein